MLIHNYLNRLATSDLSLLDKAEVLRILATTPVAAEFCRTIAEQLMVQLQPAWIAQGSLREVFAVLDALHSYGQSLSGTQVAAIAERLISCEVSVGGPYAEANGQVDPLANAYIAVCMQWLSEPLPKVQAFLASVKSDAALELVLARLQDDYTSVYAAQVPLSVTATTKPQYIALAVWYTERQGAANHGATNIDDADIQRVRRQVEKTYQLLSQPLREQALATVQKQFRADSKHEISLLPHFFADTYFGKATKLSSNQLDALGVANVHNWIAYTIYDDFLDEEGQPAQLPIANVALRAAMTLYRQHLPDHQAFQDWLTEAFNAVDAANSCEVANWRFPVTTTTITIQSLPDHKDGQLLADRAQLHIISPMAVLAAHTKDLESTIWQDSHQALRAYLIARQLGDDLHDWIVDLQNGQISLVVTHILRGLHLAPGVYRFDDLLPMARQYFWQYELPRLCELIQSRIDEARAGIKPYARHRPEQLFCFLDTLQEMKNAALRQRQQSQDFLQGLHDQPNRTL